MKSRILLLLVLGIVIPSLLPSFPVVQAEVMLPPPTPSLTLTAPKINKITYKIELSNTGRTSSSVRLDIALPKTWSPDTYIELTDIRSTRGIINNYIDRENNYISVIVTLNPRESMQTNITFYSLKYRAEYLTHNAVQNISYPNTLAIYMQPEQYIESNNTQITSLATALIGDRKNPFSIAEKLYDFTISTLRYEAQLEARGALWALLNKRGDCTEYGTLFVAMMRAVGIPARIVVGHMSNILSTGGSTNATNMSVDSPHLWAEFYVDGFGWIPVDPTSGEGDPWNHFATSSAIYLPFLKGPTMETPYRSLSTLKAQYPDSISHSATLLVSSLISLPFENQVVQDIYTANKLTNSMRYAANDAYDRAFNITDMYPSLEETYRFLFTATQTLSKGDQLTADIYAKNALQHAEANLNRLSSLVTYQADMAISRAWNELRLLGVLSGEYYLKKAVDARSTTDYGNMVQQAYYARTAADNAPNILIFIGPFVLCIITVWLITKKEKQVNLHKYSTVR